MKARKREGSWACKVQVHRFAARGTWKLGMIGLEDKAHNARVYTPVDHVVAGRVYEVQ